MADFSALKTSIQNYIKQNGNEEITGNLLQQILLSMVSTLGDSAINDLVTALNNEVSARQNADGTLQTNINNEATARGNADTGLQGLIDGITDNIENGYVYAGIATPSTTPASGKVFYLALTAGTYTNFGATVVPQGINILKYNGSAWSLDSFLGLDDAPTQGSNNLVKSGGVLDSIIKDGSAFDLSAYNSGATYADLSAALTALNALPAAYKKGGMSFKFVQSSDNKYVQYRLISNSWSIDVNDWQPQNVYVSDESFENFDFSINDENNRSVLLLKKGHVITKNFDSGKNSFGNIDSDVCDLSFSDEQNRNIVVFKNGHIRTKNFNSKDVETIKKKVLLGSRLLFDVDFSNGIPNIFKENSNWQISNGKLVSTSSSIAHRLESNKATALDKKETLCKFTIKADTYFAVGWEVPSGSWGGCSSVISVDAANNKINIHEAWWSQDSLPAIRNSIDYTFVSGRDYILKIIKDEHLNKASVIDCLTGLESDLVETTQTAIDATDNEFAGGRQLGYISVIHISGISPEISWLKVTTPKANPLMIVYGDSVVQGARLYNNESSKSWVDLLRDELGEDEVYASAIDGATIDHMLPIMNYEIPILKPKIVMVSLGTNQAQSVTQEDFQKIKALIELYDCIPIINIPPLNPYVESILRPYILQLDTNTALLDVATALNNNVADGKNWSLYADEFHPNEQGHLAMFKRFFIDTNFIYNI